MVALRTPAIDDLPIGQVTTAVLAYPAILVAHERGLFPLLSEKPRTAAEVGDALTLRPRAAEAILSIAAAADLVRVRDGVYALTEVAAEYLLRSSPTNWCSYFDFLVKNPSLFSFDSIRKALLTDAPQIHDGQEIFEVNREDTRQGEDFTRWMHSVSMAPASAWPGLVDLAEATHLLDVAGGSGAHSIGAVSRWPQLRATIFDLPNICAVAREYVSEYGLDGRIATVPGNMWKDALPPADVHFYSQIFHDWAPERCAFLARKSFDALPPGGRIVVHELLFNDDKTGPMRVASVNLFLCLLYSDGRQYSGKELVSMLDEAGFEDTRHRYTFGYWGIATGRKP